MFLVFIAALLAARCGFWVVVGLLRLGALQYPRNFTVSRRQEVVALVIRASMMVAAIAAIGLHFY